MFTLSGLILEVRKNLFRDFWSPFSIYFYFLPSGIIKKNRETDFGPYSARTPPGRGLNKARPRPEPSHPTTAACRVADAAPPHRSPQPPESDKVTAPFAAGFPEETDPVFP